MKRKDLLSLVEKFNALEVNVEGTVIRVETINAEGEALLYTQIRENYLSIVEKVPYVTNEQNQITGLTGLAPEVSASIIENYNILLDEVEKGIGGEVPLVKKVKERKTSTYISAARDKNFEQLKELITAKENSTVISYAVDYLFLTGATREAIVEKITALTANRGLKTTYTPESFINWRRKQGWIIQEADGIVKLVGII